MLHVLERNYKQSLDSAKKEFPNCHLLFSVDDSGDTEGYLLIVSDSIESNVDFDNYVKEHISKQPFSLTGFYAEEAADCVDY